jgi:Reverse transcriptase (RNA-dependent DNA polymerase)
MNTVKILLLLAINNGWYLYQMDVKNIFLQGTLEEEVLMTLPPGYGKEQNTNFVRRLEKSIYGLNNLQELSTVNYLNF